MHNGGGPDIIAGALDLAADSGLDDDGVKLSCLPLAHALMAEQGRAKLKVGYYGASAGDGSLSKAEFLAYVTELDYAAAAAEDDGSALYDAIVAKTDDGDGKLSWPEFWLGLQGLLTNEMARLHKRRSVTGTALITALKAKGLADLKVSYYEAAAGDGSLTKQEAVEWLGSLGLGDAMDETSAGELYDRLESMADSNADGKLSWVEFKSGLEWAGLAGGHGAGLQ